MFNPLKTRFRRCHIPFMSAARPAMLVSAALVVVVLALLIRDLNRQIDLFGAGPLVFVEAAAPDLNGRAQGGDAEALNRALRREGDLARWHEDFYSRHLRAMGEPALWRLARDDPDARTCRRLSLPPFTGSDAVRIVVEKDGSARVIRTILDGVSDHEPGRPVERTIVRMSHSQVRALEDVIHRSGFWTDATGVLEPSRPRAFSIADDRMIVIEAVSGGSYKLVTRGSLCMEDEMWKVVRAFDGNFAPVKELPPEVPTCFAQGERWGFVNDAVRLFLDLWRGLIRID